MRKLILLLLVGLPLHGQMVEAKHCVYHEGDDSQWAQPDYDDTNWDKAPPDLRYHWARSRFLWERCRVAAPQTTEPLFLQINSPHARKVFVDGTPVGSFGNPETGSANGAIMQQRRLPSLPE